MRKDFRFDSLSRDGIAYSWDSNYHSIENGYFKQPGRCIAPEANEYQTYDDGMVQHSPLWAVSSDNVQDFIISLLFFLKDNTEYIETVAYRWPHEKILNDRVKFYESLKYDSEKYKQPLYNKETLKKSNAESKRHDRRWEEIPNFADGSFIAVFRFLLESHFSAIDRYFRYQTINLIMDWPWIDEKELAEWIGFEHSSKENNHLQIALDALNDLIKGYRHTRDGLGKLNQLVKKHGSEADK